MTGITHDITMFGLGRCQRESLADTLCHDSRPGPSIQISGASNRLMVRKAWFPGIVRQDYGMSVNPAAADRLSCIVLAGGAERPARLGYPPQPYRSRLAAGRSFSSSKEA